MSKTEKSSETRESPGQRWLRTNGSALLQLPIFMQSAVSTYILNGYSTGHPFIEAVFSNDFVNATMSADLVNTCSFPEWAGFLVRHAPPDCWGSHAKWLKWIEAGGLEGSAKLRDSFSATAAANKANGEPGHTETS